MPHRRPLHASSETNKPHRRRTCLIGDPSETDLPHRRLTCLRSLIGILTHLNILIFIFFLSTYIYWNNIVGYVGFRWVSDETCPGLQWVSNQACRSPIGFRWVSHQACWSLMGLRLAPICLRWVYDNNNVFVNSPNNAIFHTSRVNSE